jgi:DNA-binding Lrp family transcriptional regulator
MNGTGYDEGGLIGLLKILWKRRWLIALGTAGATVLLIVIVLLLPKAYQSRAVVSLSRIKRIEQEGLLKGLEIPVYRRYSDIYRNLGLFRKFLKMKGSKEQWDLDDQFFDGHAKPIYAFDQKKPKIKTTENSILGIEIKVLDISPGKANEKAGLLGEYIVTTILNMQIGEFIESIKSSAQAAVVKMKRLIIQLELEIKDLEEKDSLITHQILKIPGIAAKTDRELVNANEKTEKYLSPRQQLVAVKVSIKDNQIRINRYLREIKINQIKLGYIDKVSQFFPDSRDFLTKRGLLETLIAEKDSFFSGKEDEENKIASYIFSEQFLSLQRRQNVIYKFISAPTLPQYHFKPKRKRIVIAGFFLVFFVFVFLAFLIEAWQRNSNKKGSSITNSTSR